MKVNEPFELPFEPVSFGAFTESLFLVLGSDEATAAPKAALIDDSGNVKRYLDLPLPSSNELAQGFSSGSLRVFAKESLGFRVRIALSAFAFSHSGSKLLLFRRHASADVIEIGSGGATRKIHLEMPDGVQIQTILPSTGGTWVAKGVVGDRVVPYLMEFDPESGRLLRKWLTGAIPASTIFCVADGKFLGVRWQSDKTIFLESER